MMSTFLTASGIARLKFFQKSPFHYFVLSSGATSHIVETHFAEQGAQGSGLTECVLAKPRRNIQVLQEMFHAAEELLRQIFII